MTTPTDFNAFNLPPKLKQALARNEFFTPTPIQAQTIPVALKGHDVLGSAQTGTGKTGAFGIPVIAGLMEKPDAAALIMTPTRELAGQVMKALEPMIPTQDIRTAVLIGGESMFKQLKQLERKPRLIVGTPGRINDHLERGSLKLGNVRYLVLDETDRMLDMGFGIQIERILKHVPDERQTLLFSATLPSNINKLSARYMRDPIRVAVGSTTEAHTKIKQEIIQVADAAKFQTLIDQLDARKGSVIIFVKTKYNTEKLAKKLTQSEHHADAIHGDLQQRRRERVIQNFRDKKYRILVATDVAARGLDIPHIAHVINYDMPQAPEDYIHRIGRTARAGAEGEAISFLGNADMPKWRAIQRLMSGGSAEPERGGGRRGGPPRNAGGKKPYWKKDRFASDAHADKREKKTDWTPDERISKDKPFSGRPHHSLHKSDRLKGKRGDRSEGENRFEARGERPQRDGKKPFWKKDGQEARGDRPQRDGKKPFWKKDGQDKRERTGGEKGWQPFDKKPRHRSYEDRPARDEQQGDRPKRFHSDRAEYKGGEHRDRKPYEGGKSGGGKFAKREGGFGKPKHGGGKFGGQKFGGQSKSAGGFGRKPRQD